MDMAINEKYLLTIREASAYFNIGIKTLRRLAENNKGNFSVWMSNRYLIIRPKFEEYICTHAVIGEDSEELEASEGEEA